MSNLIKEVFYIKKIILIITIFSIFICIFFIPILSIQSDGNSKIEFLEIDLSGEYTWPIPGYTSISSPFGKRKAPTKGASTFHYGVDIPAPEGTKFIAVCDGEITYTGFLGGGGYTITLSNGNKKYTYCHVSPNYIVKVHDLVFKGQVIGNVGPKNVYGVPGNQYSDENGNPTNGATTGCHLHFGLRIDDKYYNPLELFK